jgi:sRNA-binding regulator protein Hfq
MKLLQNQLVKILFRNGTSVEGIVEVWDPDYVLRSGDGKSLLIIQDPKQDIMAIKVILSEDHSKKPTDISEVEEVPEAVPEETPEECKELDPIRLRAMRLAEIRREAAAADARLFKERLRSHEITESKPIQYGYPSILTKIKGNK